MNKTNKIKFGILVKLSNITENSSVSHIINLYLYYIQVIIDKYRMEGIKEIILDFFPFDQTQQKYNRTHPWANTDFNFILKCRVLSKLKSVKFSEVSDK